MFIYFPQFPVEVFNLFSILTACGLEKLRISSEIPGQTNASNSTVLRLSTVLCEV